MICRRIRDSWKERNHGGRKLTRRRRGAEEESARKVESGSLLRLGLGSFAPRGGVFSAGFGELGVPLVPEGFEIFGFFGIGGGEIVLFADVGGQIDELDPFVLGGFRSLFAVGVEIGE